jgi:hypothetical protein
MGGIGLPAPNSGSYRILSDKDGIAEFTGKTYFGKYAYGGTKLGYYAVRGVEGFFEASKNGKWQPWEQTLQVIMKPIKNPVPMYVKKLNVFMPKLGEYIGYDLEKGDWVSPYGIGTKSDVEICVEGTWDNSLNFSGVLKLKFNEGGDGILAYDVDTKNRSEFIMPYEAPLTGYQPAWTWKYARTTENSPYARSVFVDESFPDRCYIFRVRSVVDAGGKLITANYGKIYGPVKFSPRANGKWVLDFVYYFNPDKTRNMEFDPKRNLFPDQNIQQP